MFSKSHSSFYDLRSKIVFHWNAMFVVFSAPDRRSIETAFELVGMLAVGRQAPVPPPQFCRMDPELMDSVSNSSKRYVIEHWPGVLLSHGRNFGSASPWELTKNLKPLPFMSAQKIASGKWKL